MNRDMAKTYKRMPFGAVAVLVPLVLALTIASCSDDYGEQLPESRNVSVHLNVSADDVIEVGLTRSYAYDYYAVAGEFIHSLCVFVVDSDGKIVKRFSTDDTTYPSIFTDDEQVLANAGNLTNWDSELDGLEEGTYTIYAFANWETTFGTVDYNSYKVWTAYDEDELEKAPWYKLISKNVEETITDEDITFAISDVCGKIDFTQGRYIPMSGKNTVTIAGGGNNVNVKLDRLVAKVQVTLQMIDTSEVYAGTSFTCSPSGCYINWFAEKMWLFPNDEATPDDSYSWGSYINLVDDPTVVFNGNAVYIGYAYVNESDIDKTEYAQYDETYIVCLELMNEDENWVLSLDPWMKTRNMPRNTILPLSITYSEYIGYPVDNISLSRKRNANPDGMDVSGSPVGWGSGK